MQNTVGGNNQNIEVKNMDISNKLIKWGAYSSRIIAGLTFTFSGFVKAVDPLGSTYKFIDYFNAFHMPWLCNFAFPLAILLASLEFLIGISLLTFIQHRLANWGAMLFMLIFTPLTLWLAISNPVHDCGCFGDALVLTNWQTFFKNVILITLVSFSFLFRDKIKIWLKPKMEWTASIAVVITISSFSIYNYQHLPIMDFRPYKIGTNIPKSMEFPEGAPSDIYEQYYTIKDTLSGKEISIESSVYAKDSTYWYSGSKWKFISASELKLVKKGYEIPITDFMILSKDDTDIKEEVLSDQGYYFLIVAYDLHQTKTKNMQNINRFYDNVQKDNQKLIGLSSAFTDEMETFKSKWNIKYDFCFVDQIPLKTIVRANPGLVLLHKGTILAKWNCNDLPDYQWVKEKYFN
ncbi:BT_3928 family protein [Draconibacterium mangrovi]|uniref:BT_3928 family protein n=1 Tax=Draconibacterium mangrovi TaxID=2697469 RepID=UPI0013D49E25|nr:BT_3928 family protein [Draconibacterium mangrovi]